MANDMLLTAKKFILVIVSTLKKRWASDAAGSPNEANSVCESSEDKEKKKD